MAIDQTLLFREVDEIVARGESLSHYSLKLRILTPHAWLTPLRLINHAVERDYEHGFGDNTTVECQMGAGDYAFDLYPYRDDLWAELTVVPLYENSDRQRRDAQRRVLRFRAILMNQDNPGLVGRSPQSDQKEDLNRTQIIQVGLQLIPEGLQQIRMVSVGRLWRQISPSDALMALLTETTALVNTNNQQQVLGVTRAAGFNTEKRQVINLPHGVTLTDAPRILQDEEGGIYPTGLGCYLQDRYWYVFPTYNLKRFPQTPRTLTVISLPPNRYMGAERTYHTKGEQVTILTAGQQDVQDQGLYRQLNEGNAARFGDARQVLGGMDETVANKTRLSRTRNMFEVEGPRLEGGLTNARWAPERTTANPLRHYSAMAQRSGRYLSAQWFHGDATLLYPGMPVKYMTVINDRVRTFYGVLLGVMENRIPREGGAVSQQFPSALELKMFLSRQGEV